MVIKKFWQSSKDLDASDYGYELTDGTIVKCKESIVAKLWWFWVSSKNSRRADTVERTVFEFIEPVEFDDIESLPDYE